MSRTIHVLLAGVVLPAFALGQPTAGAADDRAPIVVAQQDKTPEQQPAPNAKPGQQPPGARGRTPPAAGQKPQHPTAQQPGAPQRPAAQQPAAPQRPTAQQPGTPQRPTAQQPSAPQRPTAQQPPAPQ
ncbi:MAG TPA: OmpA family protein, partial [Xanthobacteraceae bacterium]|nr:OmpA family protein [Xanthobacteraceae bacterium]